MSIKCLLQIIHWYFRLSKMYGNLLSQNKVVFVCLTHRLPLFKLSAILWTRPLHPTLLKCHNPCCYVQQSCWVWHNLFIPLVYMHASAPSLWLLLWLGWTHSCFINRNLDEKIEFYFCVRLLSIAHQEQKCYIQCGGFLPSLHLIKLYNFHQVYQ